MQVAAGVALFWALFASYPANTAVVCPGTQIAASHVAQLTPFQLETVRLERRRLELQCEQLALDRDKLFWSTVSVAAPLGAALIALLATLWSMSLQASAQFRMKAAELVLTSDSPGGAARRAILLQRMFKGWLSNRFAESFSAREFPGFRLHQMRSELFRALAAKDADPQQVVESWLAVFPDEAVRFDQLFPTLAKHRPRPTDQANPSGN